MRPEAPFLISEEKDAFLEDSSNFRCVNSCSGVVCSSPLIIKGGCVLQMPQLQYLGLGEMKMSLAGQHLVYWVKKTHASLCARCRNLLVFSHLHATGSVRTSFKKIITAYNQ